MLTPSRTLIVFALACLPAAVAAQQALPPAAGGMRIFVDPATGQRMTQPPLFPPSQDAPTVELPHAAPARPALREAKGTSPAGGVLVDLQGQFDQSIEATVGARGHVDVGCKHPGEHQPGGAR